MNFLLRFLLCSALGYFLFWYLPGSDLRDQPGTLLAAVVVALMDSFIKPARVTKQFPVTIYTLALVLTLANIVLIKVCDRYIPGFETSGWALIIGVGFAMAAVSLLIDRIVKWE
ncbi:phage holin family protein [Flaviaesturariibacter terrae]